MSGQASVPYDALLAAPTVQWKHIDGPLLHWAGHMHWLTLGERLWLWLGWTTVEALAQEHWPARAQWFTQDIYDKLSRGEKP